MAEPGPRAWPCILSAGAGVAHALAMAAPWDGQPRWWLQLVMLGVLAWQLEKTTSWKRAAGLGWCFAAAWLCGTFWWLYISMHTYGGLPATIAALAVLALGGALALVYAAACGLHVKLAIERPAGRAVQFAALWLMAELARGNWFTGFGWGGTGYAHVEGPLAAYAGWVGVYGVTALAAWLSMAIPQALAGGIWMRGMVLAVLVLPALYHLNQMPVTKETGRLQVALLQGNIPQDEKFQQGTGVRTALRWYGEQLEENAAQLVVAPETALPLLPKQLPAGYWDALIRRYSQGAQAALIGMPLGSLSEGYTNSAVGLSPGRPAWRYDKHHLVPFGEFIPPGFRWFTELMHIPLGDFGRGPIGQASFEWRGQRLALNICYEDLFGEELGARFADTKQAPTVFVNLSNIAWFGNTVAIDQHLQISRMRSLEFERPFVRATNTGATAIIDHRGQVIATLPRHTRGVLLGEVDGREGQTLYSRWVSRLGLWPLWFGGLGVLLLVAYRNKWLKGP